MHVLNYDILNIKSICIDTIFVSKRPNGSQCRPGSDCFFRSSLIWVCTVCSNLSGLIPRTFMVSFSSTKGGYDQYATWKRLWSTYGKTESGVRVFIADQLLPYWVECTACQKWRQVYRETEITPQFLKTYICPKTQKVK